MSDKQVEILKQLENQIRINLNQLSDKDTEGIIELYSNICKLQNITKKYIENSVFFKEENVREELIKKNTGVKVYWIDEHIVIKINEGISNRRIIINNRISYEDILIKKLYAFRKSSNFSPYDKCHIIFEHIYPNETPDANIYDNDNYNMTEEKQIIDAIVDSGMINNDNGLNCFITNKANRNGKKRYTQIHIYPK
jgi:hypothetical protein